jgi:hypothetical protein
MISAATLTIGDQVMSIALKKTMRANPLNREEKKWYLSQVSKGYADTDQVCQDILELSSLS